MPLENASFINQLEPNNPTVTDGISQGDDHLRLIKTAIKGSFPNFSGSAVQSSEAQLDAGAAVAETGAAKLADAGAFFNTNNTDGFTNPAAGEVDVQAGGNAVVKLKSDKSATFAGKVDATAGGVVGPGAWPIGMTGIWWSDTLPDASWGQFAWCNGGEYPRSNTKLFSILGTTFGAGDGSTTANLPDLRDNTPVGKGTMGATTAVGRITAFVTNLLGRMIGGNKTLSQANLPSVNFDVNIPAGQGSHEHAAPNGEVFYTNGSTGPGAFTFATSGSAPGKPESDTAPAVLPAMSGTAASGGSAQPFDAVQPAIVCNYVIRTA